ncbi:hypothetical protein [Paenibacillus sp. SI8]|uniref:hypothetical protein n=1 Tax=unclassified Paenibacillus TaxID=185978 RepID=UPI003467990B
MNRIRSVVKMHLKDKSMWFITPWLVLAASFVINLFFAVMMNEVDSFHTGGLASIFIYVLIVGIITLKETFPLATGLSVRRTDYFLGTVSAAALANFISALILVLLSFVEGATNGWGVHLNYFQLEFLKDASLIQVGAIYLIILLNQYFLGLAISSLHGRFGRNGLFAFFAAIFLIGSLGTYLMTYYQQWGPLFEWLIHHYMELFWWMIPATALPADHLCAAS